MVGIPFGAWAAAGLVFLAVALGSLALALLLEWNQERTRRRHILRKLRSFEGSISEGTGTLFRGAGAQSPQWMQRLAARTPAFGDLQLLLQQSGSVWTIQAFLLLSVGLAVAAGLAMLVLTSIWPVAVLSSALGAIVPYLVLRLRRQRRLDAFESGLPDAIDLLARAIRAGHPLSSGLQMVAEETHDPVAGEFRRAFEEQRFGLPFEDAITAMADRVALVDVRILVTAILIQRVVGGNLAEVLDNLATVIRKRFVIRRQLRTYTAQGRISGYVLAILPIAVGTV
ncbi:MAG: type II secretion system F family protein, partial [Gemmatimonadales bacterium]|nr:type II secretion system F family protein [Gemmatimonadales bacterium]